MVPAFCEFTFPRSRHRKYMVEKMISEAVKHYEGHKREEGKKAVSEGHLRCNHC
jgi:hypothetical protein